MKFLPIAVLLWFFHMDALSQDYELKKYSQQLRVHHDNDFFVLTDRYYSSGLFISYQKILSKGIFGSNEQLKFRLGQEVFTPSQTQSTNTDLFDRPYAGFSGLQTTWSLAAQRELFKVLALFGIAGINSGAGGFQRWYHRAIVISDSPIWIDELSDSFHANIYLSYIREWNISPNPFGINLAIHPNLALGSRDVYTEAEAVIHFGRRNIIGESIAFERLGNNSREIYFALRFAYKRVFYNGLIEGNLFGDNSPVLRNTTKNLLKLGFDFNHRFNKNDYRFGVRYNSKETPNSKGHAYIVLSYGFSW
ncbi:lipid A-modifier LpxR family protein [Flagellimonas sp. 2504JD1-5]